jgi:hypothetical protein
LDAKKRLINTDTLASGIAAGSFILMAFGLDSVIELASAGALIWRLERPVFGSTHSLRS